MKKDRSLLFKILAILMIIGAIECLLFAALYNEAPASCENIDDIRISEIDDYTPLYCRELEVLARYAFQTVHEYTDSDSAYSDTTYYVYDASQPMDKNELFAEYYIVSFRDSSGNTYVTSLCVSAGKPIAATLADAPVTISACVGAAPITDRTASNSSDQQLAQLRESALDAYAQSTQLPRAQITFDYQADSLEQYRRNAQSDIATARITAAVLGIGLLALSIFLLRRIRSNKQKATEAA